MPMTASKPLLQEEAMTDEDRQELRDWAARKMGWRLESGISKINYWLESGEETVCVRYKKKDWQPTRNIEQAFEVVDRLPKDYRLQLFQTEDRRWSAKIVTVVHLNEPSKIISIATADTFAEVVSRAALKVGEEK
jgi:hypothetical protein